MAGAFQLREESLFLFNVVLVSALVCCLGCVLNRVLANRAVVFRYHLLMATVLLVLLSPLLIGVGVLAELGFAVAVADRTDSAPDNSEAQVPAAPVAEPVVGGPAASVIDVPERSAAESAARRMSVTDVSLTTSPDEAITSPSLLVVSGALALVIWALGSAVAGYRLATGLAFVRRLKRSAVAPDDRSICDRVEDMCAALGIGRVRLLESEMAPVPLTQGFWKPCIVLPSGLAGDLGETKLAGVIRHELAHVQRGDQWGSLVQSLASVIQWWNVPLHYLNGQIRQLREQLCDRMVVESTDDGFEFAETLVAVADWCISARRRVPFVPTLLDDKDCLSDRIQLLTDKGGPMAVRLDGKSCVSLTALVLALIVGMPFCTFGIESGAVATAADPKTEADPYVEWQGNWKVVRIERRGVLVGEDADPGLALPQRMQVSGRKVTVDWTRGKTSGVLNLDGSTRPERFKFDWLIPVRGIYKSGASRLTLCFNESGSPVADVPPTGFETARDSFRMLCVFEKVDANPLAPPQQRGAIERGVRYLLSHPSPTSGKSPLLVHGRAALSTLALLKAGVKPDDSTMGTRLQKLTASRSNHTYVVALETIAECTADPVLNSLAIQRNLDWLIETQTANGPGKGGWSYGPTKSTRSDGSNTRFAVWALDVASQNGFKIPKVTWKNVAEYWLNSQKTDGSWGYMPGQAKATITMTASGIYCTAAVKRALADPALGPRIDAAIKRGWHWYEQNFKPSQHLPGAQFHLYSLQVFCQAADATGYTAEDDWAEAKLKVLQSTQQPAGTWKGIGPENDLEISTSLAILAFEKCLAASEPAKQP